MALPVRPKDLPPVPEPSVASDAAIVSDNGAVVQRATPLQIVDAARPVASEVEAVAGADNGKIMTPLRVVQYVDAQTEGVGLYAALGARPVFTDLSDPDGSDLIGVVQDGSGTPGTLLEKAQRLVCLMDRPFSALDWTAAAAAARTYVGNNGPIVLERGVLNGFDQRVARSVYGEDMPEALALDYQVGSAAAPSSRREPVIVIEKVTNVEPSGWITSYDAAFEVDYVRTGGAEGRSVAATFWMRSTGACKELIGSHSRAELASTSAGGAIFGAWSIAIARAGSTPASVIGHEINVSNFASDPGWVANPGGVYRTGGLIINSDGTTASPNTFGIWLSRNTSDPELWTSGGWHTGFLISRNAIIGSNNPNEGEAIRIRGASGSGSSTRLYGGLALGDNGDGYTDAFVYGIRTKDAEFSHNAALWLASGHRITFGADPETSPFISIDGNHAHLGGGVAVYPIFRLPSGSPTLSAGNQASLSRIDDTTLRLWMRGSDGIARYHDLSLQPV